ncbi:MAG: hypothetical protein IPK83_07170 [Planctomycetes bacterium]|nr:hypothetical protein [Planctomycetota bacterium]
MKFDSVHEIREIGMECNASNSSHTSESIDWIRLWGIHYLERPDLTGMDRFVGVPSENVVCFGINNNGTETALIGLASHPAIHRFRDKTGEVEIETSLGDSYTWQKCCKTQYAGSPRHGGESNFLRVHKGLVALMDAARDLGIEVVVRDDGEYWESRDTQRLLANLREWNEKVAAITGMLTEQFREKADGVLIAPIKEHMDYEHLEAKGMGALHHQSDDTINENKA